jgi:NADPH:quinone reductase-like Zn-dependent oxidoreductase
VIATASPGKQEVVRALDADHVIDSRGADLAAEVLRLTDGADADLVLESAGGATLDASLAATKRVTGRVVVYGVAGDRHDLVRSSDRCPGSVSTDRNVWASACYNMPHTPDEISYC